MIGSVGQNKAAHVIRARKEKERKSEGKRGWGGMRERVGKAEIDKEGEASRSFSFISGLLCEVILSIRYDRHVLPYGMCDSIFPFCLFDT